MTRAVLLAILLAPAALSAENWPAWRGPRATGVSPETNLPERWSATENIAWQQPLRGAGVSSPVVFGSLVFVTSQDGSGVRRQGSHPSLTQGADRAASGERTLTGAAGGNRTRFVVTAFDRTTGRRAWEHVMDAEGELQGVHDKHNLASPSPVTDGQRVYAWFGTGQLVALDMNGTVAWQRHLAKEYGPFDINWGHASSPALYKDALILLCYHSSASYLLSVDARTGTMRWKADRGKDVISYSTPIVVEGTRGPELIVNTSEGVEAHNPETGERLWQFAEANRFPIPVPSPHDGTLYLTRGYRSGPYMAIRTGGRGDVSKTHVAWHVPTGAPYVPSAVHYNGVFYMAGENGVVNAVDAATGERVWQERIGGIFTASPVAGDGKVYFVSETGETVVLQAGRTPKVLARNTVEGHFVASPAIAGGRLFLRADNRLFAVGR
ncbi:MAG: PQQ-binding-like beta-propeller repeat protein [Vicinamibacterales bacterium]